MVSSIINFRQSSVPVFFCLRCVKNFYDFSLRMLFKCLLFWMQVFDTEIIATLMKVVINLITLNTPGIMITVMHSQPQVILQLNVVF